MAYAAAIVGTAAGILATLCTIVLLLAGGANAKPRAITQIKIMCWSLTALGLASVAGAVWLMRQGDPWTAAAVGAAPVVVVIVLVTVLVKLEW